MERRRTLWSSRTAACAAVLALLCVGAAAQGVKPVSGDVKPKAAPYTDVSFPLEHSLGAQAPFKTAGTFTARAYFDKSGSGAVKLTHLKLERLPASKEDEAAFSKLLADNWLYRVRVPGQALHPETAAETGVYAASFLPARCLAAAGYQEAWAIHSDAAGNLLSLEFTPPGGACAPDADDAGRGKAVPAGLAFRTVSVAFKAARDAPSLASTPNFDLEAALSQGAGAGEASGGVPDPLGGGAVPGEPPKEKTFMQKYGMVIWVLGIQVVLHVVKGTVAPEEPQQGQGAQRPAAVPAAK